MQDSKDAQPLMTTGFLSEESRPLGYSIEGLGPYPQWLQWFSTAAQPHMPHIASTC